MRGSRASHAASAMPADPSPDSCRSRPGSSKSPVFVQRTTVGHAHGAPLGRQQQRSQLLGRRRVPEGGVGHAGARRGPVDQPSGHPLGRRPVGAGRQRRPAGQGPQTGSASRIEHPARALLGSPVPGGGGQVVLDRGGDHRTAATRGWPAPPGRSSCPTGSGRPPARNDGPRSPGGSRGGSRTGRGPCGPGRAGPSAAGRRTRRAPRSRRTAHRAPPAQAPPGRAAPQSRRTGRSAPHRRGCDPMRRWARRPAGPCPPTDRGHRGRPAQDQRRAEIAQRRSRQLGPRRRRPGPARVAEMGREAGDDGHQGCHRHVQPPPGGQPGGQLPRQPHPGPDPECHRHDDREGGVDRT